MFFSNSFTIKLIGFHDSVSMDSFICYVLHFTVMLCLRFIYVYGYSVRMFLAIGITTALACFRQAA